MILHRYTLSAIVLATVVVLGGIPSAPALAGGSPPGTVTFEVTPRCVTAGRPASLAVTLFYVRPGEGIGFTVAPLDQKGFGGGLMGSYRADRAGIVRFRYPAPTTIKLDAGRWLLRAYRARARTTLAPGPTYTRLAAQTMFRVVLPGQRCR